MTRTRSHNRGGILPLAAILLTALLGMAALAIDLAALYATRQNAQQAADAAALGAGHLLPNTAQATAAANALLSANGANAALWTINTNVTQVTLDTGTTIAVVPGQAVTVSGSLPVPLTFAPAIGGPRSLTAPATATVLLQTACSLPIGSPVVPLGIPDTDPSLAGMLSQPPQPGVYQPQSKQATLKINVWDNKGLLKLAGNMEPVQINSGVPYSASLSSLTGQSLAASQTVTPTGGNQIVVTETGIGSRLAPTNKQFTHDYLLSPAYINWFFGDQTKVVDTSLAPITDNGTGKTYAFTQDSHRQETTDPHLMVIPIIREPVPLSTGAVSITAFAVFFMEQPNTNPNSNTMALGRFIGLSLPGAQTGACVAAGSLATRLVQ